jgi:hypothetical protein
MTHVLPAINQTMKKDVLSQASRLTASWVNGGYLRSKRADALPNIDPYSGRLLGDTELADAAVVDRAVEAGLRALKGPWADLQADGRAALLRNLADAVESERLSFAMLETLDTGNRCSTHTMTTSPLRSAFSAGSLAWPRLPMTFLPHDALAPWRASPVNRKALSESSCPGIFR